MYAEYKRVFSSSVEVPPEAEDLKTGGWSLLVSHEGPTEDKDYRTQTGSAKLNYAFAAVGEDGDIQALDRKNFFKNIIGKDGHDAVDTLSQKWDAALQDVNAATVECTRS